MIESETPEASQKPRFPSRRSLREANARLAASDTEPQLERFARPITEAAAHRTPLPQDFSDRASGNPDPVRRPRRTRRQRTAGALALLCATGLVVASAAPFFNALVVPAEGTPGPASAQQMLFSEVSLEDAPVSIDEIELVATDENTNVSYTFNPDALVNYPFRTPVMLTDPFGYRLYPVQQFHDAQDFAADSGTPIYAIADGEVLEAGYADDGCGFALKLEHQIDGHEVTSRYCHMVSDSHDLQVGDSVRMGDPAGQVGATGLAFGAHLHLAIRVDDEPADPMVFLPKYNRMTKAMLEKTESSASD